MMEAIDQKDLGNFVNNEVMKLLESWLKQGVPIPSKVIFVGWSLDKPEGREALFYVVKKNPLGLEEDEKTSRIAKIWLYAFPDHREDYLVERSWGWMSDNNRDKLAIHILSDDTKVNPANHKDNATTWEIQVYEDFIKILGGGESNDGRERIRDKIESKLEAINNHDDEAYIAKIARLLRYDPSFNQLHLKSIRKGFKIWAEKDITNLNSLFKNLYRLDSGSPLDNPDKALDFLFMWQNFSIVFSNFKEAILFFSVESTSEDKPSYARYSIAFFWDKEEHKGENKTKDFESKIFEILKEIDKEISSKKWKQMLIPNTGESQQRLQSSEDAKWSSTRAIYKRDWESKVRKLLVENVKNLKGNVIEEDIDRLVDPLMELAGHLAFSRHEGHPSRFAFIIGSEQIWPAIAEIVSFINLEPPQEFTLQELHQEIAERFKNLEFVPSLFKQICEANYSVFQIPHVVGHYNIFQKKLSKFIRLKEPSHEEQLEYSVVDLDDFFSWTISKVKKVTGENAFIVTSEGDGRIRIYGPVCQTETEGDLLLIWDKTRGTLLPPISDKDRDKIREAINLITVGDPNNGIEKKIMRVIRKISSHLTEGAALVFAFKHDLVKNYVNTMEMLLPDWLRTLDLQDPEYILRAAFVMDGASLITQEKILPRLVIYPHHKAKAWGVPDLLCFDWLDKNRIIVMLSGKGSKTHASANLSTLKKFNRNLRNPKLMVVSISADGAIKIWPQELLK